MSGHYRKRMGAASLNTTEPWAAIHGSVLARSREADGGEDDGATITEIEGVDDDGSPCVISRRTYPDHLRYHPGRLGPESVRYLVQMIDDLHRINSHAADMARLLNHRYG